MQDFVRRCRFISPDICASSRLPLPQFAKSCAHGVELGSKWVAFLREPSNIMFFFGLPIKTQQTRVPSKTHTSNRSLLYLGVSESDCFLIHPFPHCSSLSGLKSSVADSANTHTQPKTSTTTHRTIIWGSYPNLRVLPLHRILPLRARNEANRVLNTGYIKPIAIKQSIGPLHYTLLWGPSVANMALAMKGF